MDLSHQPRKELIVNEILVMKESQHPNIVNFLESYLVKSNELWLWVVMEYMEGGALTDIIENNTLEEDQISSICLEVSFFSTFLFTVFFVDYVLIFFFSFSRRVKAWGICIAKASYIEISSLITFSLMLKAELRSVRLNSISFFSIKNGD